MARLVGRLRSNFGRWTLAIACVAWAWVQVGPSSSALAIAMMGDEPTLPYGRWSVESRGLDWACRLEGLEIRESNQVGEAILVGFDRNDEGQTRVWGSSRLDRRASGPLDSRWFTAAWPSNGSTILIQVRPVASSGRLQVLVRERSKDREVGDRVRQLVLARSLDLDQPTSKRPALRFDSDSSTGRKGSLTGVFVARADGLEARAIALPDGFVTAAHPAWSPDGQRVAFAAFDASGRDPMIRLMSSIPGAPSIAVASGSMPSWSRDGSRIAYVASGRADYATDWSAPGRNDERIEAITMTGPRAGEVEVLARGIWPRWSPTDDRLAFVARADANWDIYLRSSDGLALTRLTDDPSTDTQPVWATDGRSVVFLSDRGNRWDLYRAFTAVRGPCDRITDHVRREDNPSLSPDGRHVAFVDGRANPEGTILILDLDRGVVRPFPNHSDGDRDPAWSPDGRSIAFISRRPGPLLSSGSARP